MSQPDGKQGPGEATKPKRRSLADGPAFRQAMAELEGHSAPEEAKPSPAKPMAAGKTLVIGNAPRPAPRPEAKAPEAPLPTASVRPPQRTDPGVAPPPPTSSPAPQFVAPEPAPVVAPEPAPVVAPEPAPQFVAPEPAPVAPAVAPVPIAPIAVLAPEPAPARPIERSRRGRWAGMIAACCVVGGLAIAFVALRPSSAQPQAKAPVAAAAPAPAEAPAATTPQPAAPAPSAEAPKDPSTEAAPPWLDSPQTDAPACKPLADAAPKSLSIETAIKDALRFMMQGDAKAAHAAFCFATERGAQTKTVLMGQAQVLLMQMDYRGALQVIGRELELRPSWAAQDLRGDALIRLGQVEEAKRAWFAGAGATQGSDSLIKNLLRANKSATQTSVRAGDLRRAERTLRRTIALAPRDAESCRQLADVLDKLGQAPAAARWRAYASSAL